MQKITIDPSIAVELNVDSLSVDELVKIVFEGSANWTGNYQVKIYNSSAKNTVITPSDALTVAGKVMTWTIQPKEQGLSDNNYYYELSETESKRVVFKGALVIKK
jgi:hypothetical protein